MKAVRIHEHGGPDVLKYEDAPMPEIAPDGVLITIATLYFSFHNRINE